MTGRKSSSLDEDADAGAFTLTPPSKTTPQTPGKLKGTMVKGNVKVTNVANPPKPIHTPTIITKDLIAEEIWSRQQGSYPSYAIRVFRDFPAFGLTAGDIAVTLKDKDGDDAPIYQITGTNARGEKVTYMPIDDEILRKHSIMVPEAPMVTTFDEAFQQGLELALKIYDCRESDIPKFKLFVLASQATWFLDKFQKDFINGKFFEISISGSGVFAPILAIRGVSGGGKNRMLNALRFNSYRPFWDAATNRVASLYRPMDKWHGTLFLDEADLSTEEGGDITRYLLGRCQGMAYTRVDANDARQHNVFLSFGGTGVTQRRGWGDNALEDRTAPFVVTKSRHKIPTVELLEWLEEAWELQNKLLYLRLKYWPDIHIDRNFRFDNLYDHRLTASMLVIHSLEPFAPQSIKDMTDLVMKMDLTKRENKADSFDGQIFNALWEHLEKGEAGFNHGCWYVGNGVNSDSEVIPMTTNNVAEEIANNFAAKNVRSSILNLGLFDPEKHIPKLPTQIYIGKTRYRPIWFDPEVLETHMQDFVVEYKEGDLRKCLPLSKHEQKKLLDEEEKKVAQAQKEIQEKKEASEDAKKPGV